MIGNKLMTLERQSYTEVKTGRGLLMPKPHLLQHHRFTMEDELGCMQFSSLTKHLTHHKMEKNNTKMTGNELSWSCVHKYVP